MAMTKPGGRPPKPPVGKNPGPMKPGKSKPRGGTGTNPGPVPTGGIPSNRPGPGGGNDSIKPPLPGRGRFGQVPGMPTGGRPAPGKKPTPGPRKGR